MLVWTSCRSVGMEVGRIRTRNHHDDSPRRIHSTRQPATLTVTTPVLWTTLTFTTSKDDNDSVVMTDKNDNTRRIEGSL